ncbi:MAG: ATP-binding protein [Anaerolineae bacterium]|jgi:anti-sigma regulatory factor (Ser/Thr protein kinase)|nr:ATP-binding protein [Anaerolineae bacterium]
MTNTIYRLTIPASLDAIEEACHFVGQAAEQEGMGADGVYHCALSVEEVCTNIIEHGYEGDPNHDIEIACYVIINGGERFFSITISDDAPAFNPLSIPDPDPATPLWEREGGGWGIFFVKKYMDRIAYAHHHHRNHFTFDKALP